MILPDLYMNSVYQSGPKMFNLYPKAQWGHLQKSGHKFEYSKILLRLQNDL